jgi:hypothetical protein
MKKHVLISAAFIDAACESDFIMGCANKLKDLGLHVSMHSTPDCSVIMAAQPEVTQAPVELPAPPPAEEPVPAETAPTAPTATSEPAEPPAVEVEVETPAGEVEIELPVKFEGRLLDIGTAEMFECYATEEDVSKLPVGDLDLESSPGSATFTLFDLNYKFPLDEGGCIDATISVNGKTKRTKLKPVQAVDEMFEPFQIVIGKNDAELLTASE